jgi:hypothetical protein
VRPTQVVGGCCHAVPSWLTLLTQSPSWCWEPGLWGPGQVAEGRRSARQRQLQPCVWSPEALWAVGGPGRKSQLPHLQ